MPSPACTVADGGGAPQVTPPYATVTPGNTVTIALASTAGVDVWSLACIGTDETTTPAAITLSVNSATKTATFTAPVAGKALIFRSTINAGMANGVATPSYSATFKVATATAGGLIVAALNEAYEHHATYGWTGLINALIRSGVGGSGGASLELTAAAGVTCTASPTVANADTLIYTVPASPSGANRLVLTGLTLRLGTALTGTGSVTLTAGTTAAGTDLLTAQTITSATAVGTDYGLALSGLGTAFDAAKGYNAPLAAGTTVYVRLATTVAVSGVAPVLQAHAYGMAQ